MRKALVALVCLGLFTFAGAAEDTLGAEGVQDATQDPSATAPLQSGQPPLPGDFNGDGNIDCLDSDMLVAAIIAGTNDPLYDLDGNGFVNYEDFTAPIAGWLSVAGFYNQGSPYLVADANFDSFVDALDFLQWNSNKFTNLASWCGGDFSADGVVDGQDFILWNGVKFSGSDKPSTGPSGVQVSGTPGDGVPDVYYYVTTVAAPNGQTRPFGTLSLDTDGTDWVALLVASPDLTGGSCLLCDGNTLVGNTFSSGWINGSTQWIRTNPLIGLGPSGIFDLAQLAGLGASDFPKIFDSGQASVMLAKDNGDVIHTQVTFVGGAPDIEVMPVSIDFGNVVLGTPTYRNLVIRNLGTDQLIVNGWSLNNLDFGTNLSVPEFLAPLDSLVVSQRFTPSLLGQRDASFTIASNDPVEPNVTVRLTGVGITAVSKVLLAMNDVEQSLGVDELLRIPDVGTGVGELIGSLGSNFIETEALAARDVAIPIQKSGTLQSEAPPVEEVFAVDNDRLLWLDADTGDGLLVGSIGFQDVDGIAFSPVDGKLYGITYGSNQIIQINTSTGQGVLVADEVIVGRRLEDIAFHPNGDAYILTSGPRIYKVDILTGAKLGRWELSGATSLEALVWSPDGNTLYSAADRNGSKDLVTIELSNVAETGTITFVNPVSSGFGDIEALAFLSRQTIQRLLAAYEGAPVDVVSVPRHTSLQQNVPNPFNPMTTIQFDLRQAGPVRLDVFDVSGRRVTTLVNGTLDAGQHRVEWRGTSETGQSLGSGIFYYRLRAAGFDESRRMVLLK